MTAEIVGNHDVAGRQAWSELSFDVGEEQLVIDGAVEQAKRDDVIAPQASDEGGCQVSRSKSGGTWSCCGVPRGLAHAGERVCPPTPAAKSAARRPTAVAIARSAIPQSAPIRAARVPLV